MKVSILNQICGVLVTAGRTDLAKEIVIGKLSIRERKQKILETIKNHEEAIKKLKEKLLKLREKVKYLVWRIFER